MKKNSPNSSAGHVSYERVLAGPGLRNIYEFLRDTGRGKESANSLQPSPPEILRRQSRRLGSTDPCQLCVQALDLFVSFYGAEAGNLALKMLATRGVYIGGGIAPKIIGKLQEPRFLEAFCDKGRLTPVLQLIPSPRHHERSDSTARAPPGSPPCAPNLLPPWCG